MILSTKRLEANRLNALKSTGPKTAEGKARSAQNALQHGLTAESSSLLPTECPIAYNTFVEEIRSDLRPKTPLQFMLVERITNLLWRLRRIPSAEAELFNLHNQKQKEATKARNEQRQHDHANLHFRDRQATPKPEPDPIEDHSAAQTLAEHFSKQDDKTNPFTRLHRYEMSLERSLNRCMKELRQLQKEHEKSPPLHEDPPYTPLDAEDDEPNQNEPTPPPLNASSPSTLQNEPTPSPSASSSILDDAPSSIPSLCLSPSSPTPLPIADALSTLLESAARALPPH